MFANRRPQPQAGTKRWEDARSIKLCPYAACSAQPRRTSMNAFEMQAAGYVLIAAGTVFFIISQILLGRWLRAYRSETRL